MTRRGIGVVLALTMASACRRDEADRRAQLASLDPTPAPPAVEAPPRPEVEPTWTPEPEPAPRGAPIAVSVRASPTPVDIDAIPNFDRPRDPTPASRVEELARCLTYRVTVDPTFSSSSRVRLVVRVRNTCATWVPAEDSWFEVVSKPSSGGGTVARELGRFQAAIPPGSSHVETVIEIECPAAYGGCRYEASFWLPSGGGRNFE